MKIQRALLIASAASVLTVTTRFIALKQQTYRFTKNPPSSSHHNINSNDRQLSIFHLFSDLFRGIRTRHLTVDGAKREFLEIGRRHFANGSPAVILLHGRPGSMRQVIHDKATKVWLQRQKEEGFLLLVPDGLNRRWNELRQPDLRNPDDVAFLTAVADHARQVGADKLFITGLSNGALMSYTMALERPGLFTAVAAFIANMPDPLPALATTPVPMFIMLGTQDPLMKPEGGVVVEDDDFSKPVVSAVATVDYWIESNNAAAQPSINTTLPDDDPTDDSCTIRSLFYEPNNNPPPTTRGAPVHYYIMEGGGHVVPLLGRTQQTQIGTNLVGPPCGDANGVDLAWAFFREYL